MRVGEFQSRRVLGRVDRDEMIVGPEFEPDESAQLVKRAQVAGRDLRVNAD